MQVAPELRRAMPGLKGESGGSHVPEFGFKKRRRQPVGDAGRGQRSFVGLAQFQQFDAVRIEKPIDVTGTLARRLSTSLASECDLCRALNSTVSSNTDLPSCSTEGIDLYKSQVHS